MASWDSGRAYNHLYRVAPEDENKSKPGIYVRVHYLYEGRSNFRKYDKVLSIDGVKLRDGWHFDEILDKTPAGQSFTFEVVRDGRRMTVTETFGEEKDGYGEFKRCLKVPRRWLGVYLVQTLDLEWRKTLKMRDQGMFRYSSLCYVLDVYPGSPVDKAGVKVADFIIHYGVDDDNGEVMPRARICSF